MLRLYNWHTHNMKVHHGFQILVGEWMTVTQSCPIFCDPMNYTLHGILQAKILKWVAFPFSRGSSQLRGQTQVSCIAGRFFYQLNQQESRGRGLLLLCAKYWAMGVNGVFVSILASLSTFIHLCKHALQRLLSLCLCPTATVNCFVTQR